MRSLGTAAVLTLLAASPSHAVSVDVYAVCKLDPNGDNFLALRAGPSTQHRMLMKLPPGARIEEWGRVGNWMEVDVQMPGRPSGYVYAAYTCLVEDH